MAYVQHDLGLDVRRNPAAARTEIIAALNQAEGMVVEAADALGVSMRTMFRWISLLGLAAHVHEMKRQYKHPPRGRRGKRVAAA